MEFNIPMLTGMSWVLPVFAGLAVIMIVKWFIDILP